ncbi:MAG: hypothetical protein GXZ12_04080 [Clostridiaceae bacterium]|jgi:hypothetical protein|nr:hypothetical protein [Clostridia bacterium]NLX68600.1 hypothetical protein [Clostridiaceae bacterium]HRV50569.1 hypothetical protein [Saccharofermentans sp.]
MKKHQNVAASKTENKTNIRETNIRKTSIRESNTRKNNLRKPVNRKASKKISISVFTIILPIWLILITVFICWFYGKANSYMVHYEEVYQLSLPEHVAEEVFAHFKDYDINYILDNMAETSVPRISGFESEDSVITYIRNMLEGKELTYQPSNNFSDSMPTYVVEADGFVVAEFTLCKDLQNPREFGFASWQLKEINYYTEPFETVNITAPTNFNVYVNGILLDDTYVCSDEVQPADASYVQDYATIPGNHDFYVADLYLEPEVRITDMYDEEVTVTYDESTDFYYAGYSDQHPERDELEAFAIDYTSTFANVISRDEQLTSLLPFFPANSELYDSISRNTSLLFFDPHSDTTIDNEEILDFITYSEDVVYIEVYLEQNMTMGYNDIEVVPTTARLYCVRIDGEWKVVSMRF